MQTISKNPSLKMLKTCGISLGIGLLLTLSSITYAQTHAQVHGHGAAFAQENDVAMAKMMKDMHAAPSGNVDRDFITMMIPHHQGAIDMCEALIRHGSDAKLKTLCANIISEQAKEIAIMRDLLGKIPDQAAAHAPATMQTNPHGDHAHH